MEYFIALFVCLAFMPILQAAWLKYFNPRCTIPMLLRRLKHKRLGLVCSRSEYQWIGIDEISPRLLECLWAAEDPEFFNHFGFDFEAIRVAIEDSKKD